MKNQAFRASALCVLAMGWLGCSTVQQVPLESITADGIGKATVVSRDNYVYNFERVQTRGDSLVGTYFVVEERASADGGVAFVDVPHHTILPAERVSRVEVKRLDYANTALLGAGATLFAIWATSLSDEKETRPTYGNTKGLPGP